VPFHRVQPAFALAAARADVDLPLAALAARAGLSPFHLHRLFVAVAGETPKQYTLRLRVARAAVLLLTTDQAVLDIALSCGFQSHEAFTRAFRKQFSMAPRSYRQRGFAGVVAAGGASSHAAVVRRVGPCIRLFHIPVDGPFMRSEMSYDVVEKELVPQSVLVARRRIKRSEIAAAIGEALPHIFHYAQQRGLALAGHPFTRYIDIGAGLLTIEPGMRVVGREAGAAGDGTAPRTAQAPGLPDGAVVEDMLPGGPTATTVHAGSYESLSDAYAALESWMEANGRSASGPPWESYITDPAEHPDPKDWKTEVAWPIGARSS
jgi:AraC family transcriptional regulator